MATIAILSLNTTFKDIQSAISSKYGKTEFDDLDADIDYGGTDSKGKYSLYFKDRKENRRMYIALENSCKEDNNIEGV